MEKLKKLQERKDLLESQKLQHVSVSWQLLIDYMTIVTGTLQRRGSQGRITRTLNWGGGGVYVHIIMFCPTNFIWFQKKVVGQNTNYEYTLPPINLTVTVILIQHLPTSFKCFWRLLFSSPI